MLTPMCTKNARRNTVKSQRVGDVLRSNLIIKNVLVSVLFRISDQIKDSFNIYRSAFNSFSQIAVNNLLFVLTRNADVLMFAASAKQILNLFSGCEDIN